MITDITLNTVIQTESVIKNYVLLTFPNNQLGGYTRLLMKMYQLKIEII